MYTFTTWHCRVREVFMRHTSRTCHHPLSSRPLGKQVSMDCAFAQTESGASRSGSRAQSSACLQGPKVQHRVHGTIANAAQGHVESIGARTGLCCRANAWCAADCADHARDKENNTNITNAQTRGVRIARLLCSRKGIARMEKREMEEAVQYYRQLLCQSSQ